MSLSQEQPQQRLQNLENSLFLYRAGKPGYNRDYLTDCLMWNGGSNWRTTVTRQGNGSSRWSEIPALCGNVAQEYRYGVQLRYFMLLHSLHPQDQLALQAHNHHHHHYYFPVGLPLSLPSDSAIDLVR